MLLDSGIGVIPFINEIIKQNKKNDYYIFMDHEFFPYGSKSENALFKRLKYLFKKFESLNLDYLLICCNTLSKVYLNHHFKTNFKIKTILELNLKHLHRKNILVTPLLKKMFNDDSRFISCELAKYIEHQETKNILKEIKSLNLSPRIILGCTHYPLIKNIFAHYDIKAISYESEFIAHLKQDMTLSFTMGEYEMKIILKYYPHLDIKIINY